MSTHYTDGRRWSHISNAWILLESWNDKEEIASLKAQVAYALNRGCQHCAVSDDATFVVECGGCRARHRAKLAAEEAEQADRRTEQLQNFIDGLALYISQLEAVPGNSTLTMFLRHLMKAHGVGSAA